MDIGDRIARRQTARRGHAVVVDRDQLSPVVHVPEPVGRGPVLEELLDAIDAVFDGSLPPEFAVVGPHGAGKSAVVTALFDALNDRFGRANGRIGTTTRAGSGGAVTWFACIDGRRVRSPFAFYRALLSVVSADPVPESGVGTDALRERVRRRLERPDRRVVVAIDHHDEPETLAYDAARELLEPVTENVTMAAVGHAVPEGFDGPTVTVPAYRRHELIDVVTERASEGLAPGSFDHESIRDLATWADGNAHDALAALFGAAVLAEEHDADRLDDEYLVRARADVPAEGIHLDRTLALPGTRQQVLRNLLSLESTDRPISEVASDVAASSSLTAGTIKRFLYELADRGVVERVPLASNGSGRRPSTVEPQFPAISFLALSAKTE